jgi:drug/metabolite transporter (DMT)-like permease
MILWTMIVRSPMRFSLVAHVKFVFMGALMFCINFALFYNASIYLASGLLSVVFSLASVFNIIIAVLFFGLKPGANVVIGALLGFSGIGMMFWPVVAQQSFDAAAFFGLGLCIAGTLCFCTGNLISASLQKSKVPVVSASAWGMTYGAGLSGLITFAQGDAFTIDWSITYISSLVFLAIVSSVIAFAAYLTLLGRIGADRAGYATVLFPVIALMISAIMEDYRMSMLAVAGLALVLLGNVFVLGNRRRK